MNTIAFYFALGLIGLFIFSRIPGMKLIFEPIETLIYDLTKFILSNISFWLLWIVKNIWKSHTSLIYHLTHNKETIDPISVARESNNGN